MSELLAQLNPHSKDLRMLPPGFQAITAIDIAHAVGRINKKGARLLIRYKYAGHDQFFPSLVRELITEVKKISLKERWRNKQDEEKLSQIAILIFSRQPRCGKCRGIGSRMWGARKITCPTCRGNSWQRIYDSDISDTLGIKSTTYAKTHKRRLGAAMSVLTDWEQDALRVLNKSMR